MVKMGYCEYWPNIWVVTVYGDRSEVTIYIFWSNTDLYSSEEP